MAKAVKKKASKKRANTYDPKLAIKGTFEDVIGVSVGKKISKNNNGAKEKEGKNTFTKTEASEIRKIVQKLPTHKREIQMRVRANLRKKYSFYISDFTSGKGFDQRAFDYFVYIGDIIIL